MQHGRALNLSFASLTIHLLALRVKFDVALRLALLLALPLALPVALPLCASCGTVSGAFCGTALPTISICSSRLHRMQGWFKAHWLQRSQRAQRLQRSLDDSLSELPNGAAGLPVALPLARPAALSSALPAGLPSALPEALSLALPAALLLLGSEPVQSARSGPARWRRAAETDDTMIRARMSLASDAVAGE